MKKDALWGVFLLRKMKSEEVWCPCGTIGIHGRENPARVIARSEATRQSASSCVRCGTGKKRTDSHVGLTPSSE